MNLRRLLLPLAALFLALSPGAQGREIIWRSLAFTTNLDSASQNMGSSFEFQLGVFTGGFTPSAENITQWQSRWVPAGTAVYNPSAGGFTGLLTVTSNAAPFTFGAKAYVWGRSTGSARSEWMLFRGTTWTWPAPAPMEPEQLVWNAAAANDVILGSINATGSPYHLKSAAIFSYDQWKLTELAGQPLNRPKDDPDGDGLSNLLEFIFGTSPVSPSRVATPVTTSGGYLEMTVPRLRDRLAQLTVQVSGDLVTWNSGDAYVQVTGNTPTSLVVRDLVQQGPANPKRFIRLKAEQATP